MSDVVRLPVPRQHQGEERDIARDRLGASIRALLDTVVGTTASTAQLDNATAAIDVIAEALATSPAARPMQDSPFHPLSLVGGSAHPVAPQLELERTSDGVTGSVTLGPVFEGGPSLAHGGVLALLFDHSMGTAVFLAGFTAMTRTLDVHYLAPTPLDVELTVDARIERASGRRVHVTATIATPDAVTARADAIFVTLTSENLARIFA